MTARTHRFAFLVAAAFTAIVSGCKRSSDAPCSDTPAPTGSRPSIAAVTPTEVKAGALITVTGSGFGTKGCTTELIVGGAKATSIASWSDSEITAVLPDAALSGAVKVRVQGNASEERPLVVLWDEENPENVVVGGNRFSPLFAQLLSDGEGGAIVVWNDYRSYDPIPGDPSSAGAARINIHAQRLSSRGKLLWRSGGVPLSTAPGGQFFPQLVSDGGGGAIVVWEDFRNGSDYDIYAQRISRAGDLVWASNVPVCAAARNQELPKIASDGAGGAIIAWQDYRSGSQFEVFAQRIDANGVPRWSANGVPISSAPQNAEFLFPEIVSDGAGGAIIVWQDHRSGEWRLYAQRIDRGGAIRWAANGVPVSTVAASYQYGLPRPVEDGLGGAIVAWESSGGPTSTDLYAQRIDGSGSLQWRSTGTVVSAAAGEQTAARLITDGEGGAILAWEDCRVGWWPRDIYAQRVSASGTARWIADGVPVSTAADGQYGPRLVTDGKSGAIITWYDYRNYDTWSDGTLQGADAFAQRLNEDGATQWETDGAPISTAALHQMYPEITSDHSGGAIIVWEDSRAVSSVALYAQGISFGGRQ